MPDVKKSKFLIRLMEAAGNAAGKGSGTVTAEKLICAALEMMGQAPESLETEERRELRAAAVVLKKYGAAAGEVKARLRRHLLSGSGTTYTDILYLQEKLREANQRAMESGRSELTADLLLRCILEDPGEALGRCLADPGAESGGEEDPEDAEARRRARTAALLDTVRKAKENRESSGREDYAWLRGGEGSDAPEEADGIAGEIFPPDMSTREKIGRLVEVVKQIRAALLEKVFGQDNAVSVFANGFFQGELNALIDGKRTRPRATFLFAGPPGVGKTFLAETAAEVLKLPFMRFDMSEYADKESTLQLCGSDAVYKDSRPGLLTDFVSRHPKCILLFDEIEKAHLHAIHLFLQILDAGRLKDAKTRKDVSFCDTICIFTTNAGKKLYEESESGDLSGCSRKVILRALERDVNPMTGVPYFPEAICSRFASGNVVMFNRMSAHDLRGIARSVISRQIHSLTEKSDIAARVDERVYTALLLAEGGSADARMVRGRALSFFSGELFELLRLIDSDKTRTGLGELKEVRFTVRLPEDDAGIRDLFEMPPDTTAVVFAPAAAADWCRKNQSVCRLAAAETLEQGKALLEKTAAEFVLLDMNVGKDAAPDGFLNAEDVESEARDFFWHVREKRPELPVYIIARSDEEYSVEEELSFRQMGVQGFLPIGRDGAAFASGIGEICESLHQQRNIEALARSNRIVSFETGQRISADGRTAEICLFDFEFSTAVDAEDSGNIMSSLSRPNVRFGDVIGAEDAKKELGYFVRYLQDPKKYAETGVSAPKGVLLYGPPGTGKTMLAKAMACESGATFLAAEGNQFLKKYVGEGPEAVHELFRAARKYAPSILFVDEIDAIAKQRTGSEQSESREEILTAFLTEMDGFRADPAKPVFVLAATNFDVEPGGRTSLDSALMRRFDRRICVDLPNREERIRYLKQETAKKPIFRISGEMMENLAIRATGMSLASLASVLELSLRTAIRDGKEEVTDAVLEEAFETFNSGEAKKWDPAELERTARHEAGHALLSWLAGDKPSYLTIVARADHGGYMQHGDGESKSLYTKNELLSRIRTALGGRAAEIVCYGPEEGVSTGASGDLASATAIARRIICSYGMDEEFGLAALEPGEAGSPELRRAVNRILAEEMKKAVELISANRGRLDALTDRLLTVNRMTGPEIDAVLSGRA